MRIRVLGTAAGGGLPQWNCSCPGCRTAREAGRTLRQDTLAVTGDGRSWYLLNAAPDLRLDPPELHPGPGLRETPIRGVLLTSAELDHTTGLLALREASALSVYATPQVLAVAPALPLLDAYTTVTRTPLTCGSPLALAGGLTVTAFPLGAKRPRYAGVAVKGPPCAGAAGCLRDASAAVEYLRDASAAAECLRDASPAVERPGCAGVPAVGIVGAGAVGPGAAGGIGPGVGEWVIGLRITDGRFTAVYAPCLGAWSDELTRADLVLLDGTFFTDDELRRRTGVDRTARQMGHLPIEESLPLLAHGPRYLYTHLNNTNPVAHPGSPELALLRRFGADVAEDGALLHDHPQ